MMQKTGKVTALQNKKFNEFEVLTSIVQQNYSVIKVNILF